MNRSEIRKIGGSNIASILGKSPYESAHSLYLRLTGELPPKDDCDVMRWGRELESRVADMFADGHDEYTIEPHGMVTHPDYDFLIASPDRILLQDGKPVGVLEIKTSDIGMRQEFGEQMTDEIPFHFILQLTWYLGMMNLPEGYVAVYFRKPGRKAFAAYQEHYVKFEPDLFGFMVQKAVEFWNNHVVPRIAPEITEPDAITVEYYSRRERNKDSMMFSDEVLEDQIEKFRLAQSHLKEAKRMEELEKTQLLEMMGTSEGIIDRYTGKNILTFKEQSNTSFDHKALCADLELDDEVIEKYRRKTQFRVLRLAK